MEDVAYYFATAFVKQLIENDVAHSFQISQWKKKFKVKFLENVYQSVTLALAFRQIVRRYFPSVMFPRVSPFFFSFSLCLSVKMRSCKVVGWRRRWYREREMKEDDGGGGHKPVEGSEK